MTSQSLTPPVATSYSLKPDSDRRCDDTTTVARPDHGRDASFRPDIEGLRGIAVLSVVLFHCGIAGVSGGFVGVDVFFVLSGYLITGLLAREWDATGLINLRRFYARRARRLLPAAVLVALTTLAAAAIFLGPNELISAGRAARANSVYMSNIMFARDASNYFAPAVKTNPMLHTWSLAVEEQFYLVWPLLLILALRGQRSQRRVFVLLCALTLVSLAASIYFTSANPTFAFYELPTRAWEFGIGGVGVLLPRRVMDLRAVSWLGWAGLLTTVGAMHFISPRFPFPGFVALFPVVGTAVALVAGAAPKPKSLTRLLGCPPLLFLGKMSYSWYLWHWPILVFAIALVPNIGIPGRCLAVLAALAVASIAHRYIENPLRFHPVLVRRSIASLTVGGGLLAVLFGASLMTIRFANRLAATPAMKSIAMAAADIASMPREQCVSLGNSGLKTCDFGADSSAERIVLFGDSHAIQWFNALRGLTQLHGWKLTTVVKSGCPATDVELLADAAHHVCQAWRVAALKKIQSLHPALVIMASASMYVAPIGGADREAPVTLDDWRLGTKRTLEALALATSHIAFVRDTPTPGFDVPACLAIAARHSWYPVSACQLERARSLNGAFEVERRATQRIASVHVIDMTDEICPTDACPTFRDGLIVFRDDNHMTGRFAEHLRPALESKLMPDLPVTHR